TSPARSCASRPGTDSTPRPHGARLCAPTGDRSRALRQEPPAASVRSSARGVCRFDYSPPREDMIQGEVSMAASARAHPLSREPWRTRSTRPVYDNRGIRVRGDVALMPDGRSTIYGVVECSECVGILPFVDADTVLLVGQYRYVAQGFYWEMPTGGMHPGESPAAGAQRELGGEAGCEAGSLVKICDFHTSKSILRETAHLFLARDLRPASRPPDPT